MRQTGGGAFVLRQLSTNRLTVRSLPRYPTARTSFVQVRSDLTAFLPAADQVGTESIESAWPLTERSAQFRSGADVDEFSNGGAIEMELLSDRCDRQTFAMKRVDLRMPTLVPTLDSARRREDRHWWSRKLIRCRQLVSRQLLVQWSQHANGHAFKSIYEVVDYVPAIGHLDGIWGVWRRWRTRHLGRDR